MLIENKQLFDSLVFVLNDNVPDGHDVSWIYDIDPELLAEASSDKTVFVTGKRAYDMASRLHYAGVVFDEEHVHSDLSTCLNDVTSNESVKSVFVLPNYSAMLETRKILVGRKIL